MAGSGARGGGGLRDGLIAAAHQEILRLKEVNERLLQAQAESMFPDLLYAHKCTMLLEVRSVLKQHDLAL